MKSPYGGGQKPGGGSRSENLPHNYLNGGYFDRDGKLIPDLLTDTANKVAKSFGLDLSTGQLKRFYGHAKTAEKAFNYSGDAIKLVLDNLAMDAFVAEAFGKKKVPKSFYQFINKNVLTIKDSKDIIKGFLPHFQAVVAYHRYHYGEVRERRT